jgi:hypothetical protein
MNTLKPTDIHGSWTLESFEIEDPSKVITPWGKDAHGLLIYGSDGYMNVSINKAIQNDSLNEFENVFDSILFYSGTYTFDGSLIRHQVTNASKPARIGREMLRYAKIDGDLLTLVTPQESFGRAILKWRKIK